MQTLFWVWFIFMMVQMAVVAVMMPVKHRLKWRDLIWFGLGAFDFLIVGIIIGAS